jgi:hypothetical protein
MAFLCLAEQFQSVKKEGKPNACKCQIPKIVWYRAVEEEKALPKVEERVLSTCRPSHTLPWNTKVFHALALFGLFRHHRGLGGFDLHQWISHRQRRPRSNSRANEK